MIPQKRKLRILRYCEQHDISYFYLCAECAVNEIMRSTEQIATTLCRFCWQQEPVFPGHAACRECEREHGGG